MKIVKQLFKAFEKQGLIKGSLSHKNQTFIYNRDTGIEVVAAEKTLSQREPDRDALEVEIDLKKKISTIKRKNKSTKSEIEYREDGQSKKIEQVIPAAKKGSKLLLRLTVIFFALVIGLLIFIVSLNKKMSDSESVPLEMSESEIPGETNNQNSDEQVDATVSNGELLDPAQKNSIESGQDSTDNKKNGYESETLQPKETSEITKKTEPEKPIKRPEDRKPPAYKPTVTIRDISPALIQEYHQRLKTIRIDLPRKAKVSGSINIKLFIDKEGKIYQFQLNNTGMSVKPKSKLNTVLLRVKKAISNIRVKPPKDKYGRQVSIENWRLNFMVTQFKKRMILRKQ